ncbi:MAG: filamentous hemagglutinin N-terminal domain-containing protein, partial [Candidatus Pacebacteria bacterium]|nr:filamentous hemagglutinin N-terminal domain-containing protein [Candidatus Paceibacterota bacterium]
MNSSAVPKKIRFLSSTALATLLLASLTMLPQRAMALPSGSRVTSGTAAISTNATNTTTTITQTSDRAVIDWTSFDLAANETVQFIVPTSSSATLNRIATAQSTIAGTITSNGAVYFTNPNGLTFDANSRVTTNGLVASTGTITPTNFMNQTAPQFSALTTATIALGGTMAGDVRIEAATVTVPTNLSITGGNLYFNLPSSGTVTTSNGGQITTNGNSILFSGASSGNNVTLNLAGVNGGANGVFYNSSFMTGNQTAVSNLSKTAVNNGFTVNNGTIGIGLVTTGVLAIDGIRKTSPEPLWLEGGGVSMLTSHIDLQGSVTVVGRTLLTTSGSTSAVIFFNEGINVWGSGANITIKQIGDFGTASDDVNNTIMAINMDSNSLWAPNGNVTLSSSGAITTSGGAIGIRLYYTYLNSNGTTLISQSGAITSRTQANTVGIKIENFYPTTPSLIVKQDGLIVGTASQGPSVYGIDMRNSILQVAQISLSKIGGLESVANVGIWGIYSRSNRYVVSGGAGSNNMVLDAGVTRMRMGDDTITTSGSSITVRGDSMNLNGAVSSSGGAVILAFTRSNLTSSRYLANSGAYTNNAADSAVGQVWTTSNQNLTLNADGLGLALDQTVFNLGNGSLTSNRRKFGTNIYVSNDPMITAANIATVTGDSSAEYHSLTEFINGISGYGLTGWGGTISYRN